jgi:hypothetical protein
MDLELANDEVEEAVVGVARAFHRGAAGAPIVLIS